MAIWDKPGWRTKNPGHNVTFNVVFLSCCEWGSGIEKILNRLPHAETWKKVKIVD